MYIYIRLAWVLDNVLSAFYSIGTYSHIYYKLRLNTFACIIG